MQPRRLQALLVPLWWGGLLTIALVAAPAAFQTLDRPLAGRVVARLFAVEAATSLILALAVVLLERWRFRLLGQAPTMNGCVLLPLVALFCTVAGYYALQPLMDAARAGQGPWSFGALHTLSLLFYGLKVVAVGLLAWWLSDSADPLARN